MGTLERKTRRPRGDSDVCDKQTHEEWSATTVPGGVDSRNRKSGQSYPSRHRRKSPARSFHPKCSAGNRGFCRSRGCAAVMATSAEALASSRRHKTEVTSTGVGDLVIALPQQCTASSAVQISQEHPSGTPQERIKRKAHEDADERPGVIVRNDAVKQHSYEKTSEAGKQCVGKHQEQ